MLRITTSLLLLATAESLAPVAPDVKEWTVPWEGTRPRDPFVDAKGRVWFVGQSGNYVAYLEPNSGRFERYDIEEGTHPHNLVVDGKGMVWYTGNQNGRLVRLDPDSRKLTDFLMPDPAVRDPHTMIIDQGRQCLVHGPERRCGRKARRRKRRDPPVEDRRRHPPLRHRVRRWRPGVVRSLRDQRAGCHRSPDHGAPPIRAPRRRATAPYRRHL